MATLCCVSRPLRLSAFITISSCLSVESEAAGLLAPFIDDPLVVWKRIPQRPGQKCASTRPGQELRFEGPAKSQAPLGERIHCPRECCRLDWAEESGVQRGSIRRRFGLLSLIIGGAGKRRTGHDKRQTIAHKHDIRLTMPADGSSRCRSQLRRGGRVGRRPAFGQRHRRLHEPSSRRASRDGRRSARRQPATDARNTSKTLGFWHP